MYNNEETLLDEEYNNPDLISNPKSIQEYTVSEISSIIKNLLENNLSYVQVRGEISGLKIASSGHAYFSLKDNNAVLGCTCWRHTLIRIPFNLQDGMQVVIAGKITAYGGQSRYQLSVQTVTRFGLGDMMLRLQELKERLQKEGLFDANRKKAIPFMPQKIGIVTSITGAVIKDIIHRIEDRCPVNLIIWPTMVQGDNAAAEISQAIKGFNQMPLAQQPQLLIIARGGGSIEDLWPFNEEIVVRAVAESEIPIISAVGHETDYTLIDLVADLRAPTPTAAAELATPVVENLRYTLNMHYSKLVSNLKKFIQYQDNILINYERNLKHLISNIQHKTQRLDEITFRLQDSLPKMLNVKNHQLAKFTISSLSPQNIIQYKSLKLYNLNAQFDQAILRYLSKLTTKIEMHNNLLTSLDYNRVLQRGFTIIQDSNKHHVISSISKATDIMDIKFKDGVLGVKKINL